MRVALFISIALLTGWVTTSSLDTQKRLKAIEKQQTTALAEINKKISGLYPIAISADFEAQQAKAFASNNNDKIRDITGTVNATEKMTIDNITALHEMKKQQENLSNFVELQVIGSRPKAPPASPPPFTPSRKIDIGRDLEKERELRALEGIESALEFQNNYR